MELPNATARENWTYTAVLRQPAGPSLSWLEQTSNI
jgi:hypothetical protein